MSNDISSIQNQFQNITQIHHSGGGRAKKNNIIQFAICEDEKDAEIRNKKPFKSEITAKIGVNPDADSKQEKKQQDDKPSKEQNEDRLSEEKSFGLDTLELIGRNNMMTIYTLGANIKKSD